MEVVMPFTPKLDFAPRQWPWPTLGNALLVGSLLVVFFFSGGFLDPQHDYLLRFGQAFVAWAQTGVKGNGHEKPLFYWLQLFALYEWPGLIGLFYALRAAGNQFCRWNLWQSLCVGIAVTIFLTVLNAHQALGHKGLHDYLFVTPGQVPTLTYLYAILGGALAGSIYYFLAFLPPMNRLTRLLAIYGWGTLVAYSWVPYKTPWCIISLLWPFLILFGEAIDGLLGGSRWQRWTGRGLAGVVLGVSLVRGAWLNYYRPTDPTERYVYVQTLNDYFKLMNPLKRLVAIDVTAWHMPAHILLSSYHPLPWALGDFTSIGYYENADTPPSTMDAGFIVAEADRTAEVEKRLRQRYFVESFHLRDAMDAGKLYLSYSRFARVFPGRRPEFEPSKEEPPVPVPAGNANTPAPIEPPHTIGPVSPPAGTPIRPFHTLPHRMSPTK